MQSVLEAFKTLLKLSFKDNGMAIHVIIFTNVDKNCREKKGC